MNPITIKFKPTMNSLKEFAFAPVPSFLPQIFGDCFPLREKPVYFISDQSGYNWFNVESLCKAFDVDPSIFAGLTTEFCTSIESGQGDTFVNEVDIFSTPLVRHDDFSGWYFDGAIYHMFGFNNFTKLASEKMHIKKLKEVLTMLEQSKNEFIRDTLNSESTDD